MVNGQDIWNLGQVLGLFTPEHYPKFKDMKRELGRARALDQKALNEDGVSQSGIIVRGVLEGQSEPASIELQQHVVTKGWITFIRDKFKGKVMRRTGNSKDNMGNLISGVAPPSEHLILLDLYEWEKENLEQLADSLLQSAGRGTKLGNGEVSVYTYLQGYQLSWTPICTQQTLILAPVYQCMSLAQMSYVRSSWTPTQM